MMISKNVKKWIQRASDETCSCDPERMVDWLAEQCFRLEFDLRTALFLLDFAKTEMDELSARLEEKQ